MLQENSFFSRPLTYFGSHPNSNEEELEEDDDDDLPWQISLSGEIDLLHFSQQKIGVFIQWTHLS